MADIVLTGIREYEIGERQVFNTGINTVGRGGDNFMCGHCGHKMLSDFNMEKLEVELVFKCGACKGHNVKPSAE